jgi:hypothetical protein
MSDLRAWLDGVRINASPMSEPIQMPALDWESVLSSRIDGEHGRYNRAGRHWQMSGETSDGLKPSDSSSWYAL